MGTEGEATATGTGSKGSNGSGRGWGPSPGNGGATGLEVGEKWLVDGKRELSKLREQGLG